MISGYRGLAESLISTFVKSHRPLSVLVKNEAAIPNLVDRFPEVQFVPGDVSDRLSCDAWIAKAASLGHPIGALVNNAAITGPVGKLEEIDFDFFEQTLKINLVSPVYLTQRLLPHFREAGQGVVINFSGGGATFARPNFSAYAASKCALVRLTETFSKEYPQFHFYAISPGALRTPMLEAMLKIDPEKIGGEYTDAKRRLEQGGEDPQKAADLVFWLVSAKPQYLNGKLISSIWDKYKDEESVHRPENLGWWTLRRVDQKLEENLNLYKECQ
jgi:NAD(P)-dependent dehydrogenase (short-subunit alcohol dehydrogenase family)